MTDTTKADKLGEDGAKRAEALHEARRVLAPVAIFGSGQTLDAEGVDLLVELAEYIATGEHAALEGYDEDDRTLAQQVVDFAADAGVNLDPWQVELVRKAFPEGPLPDVTLSRPRARGGYTGPTLAALRDELAQFAAGLADDEQADPIGAEVDDVLGEAYEAARIDPRTHREPNREAVLVDRQGDEWQFDEELGGWTMPGALDGVPWLADDHQAWAPFTIKGAHPNVARELAKWRPGQHGEPPRDAVLVDTFGREWEHVVDAVWSGWKVVRGAQRIDVLLPTPFVWDSSRMRGRVFTIKAAG